MKNLLGIYWDNFCLWFVSNALPKRMIYWSFYHVLSYHKGNPFTAPANESYEAFLRDNHLPAYGWEWKMSNGSD